MMLQIAALCYANRQRTDGELPAKVARNLLEIPQIGRVINRLVKLGVWVKVANGYQIHDYHEYQLSRAQMDEIRERRSAAGRVGGRHSGASRTKQTASKSEANGQANRQANRSQFVPTSLNEPATPTQPNPSISNSSSSLTSVGDSGSEDDDDDSEILNGVWVELVERRRQANKTQINNPAAWTVRVRRDVVPLHEAQARQLVRNGMRDPLAIADKLEPRAHTEPETTPAYGRVRTDCDACGGSGWLEVGDIAEPCERCEQARLT